jgi:hypothetical protein
MPMHMRRGGLTWQRVIYAALGLALAGLWATAIVMTVR